MKKTILSMLVVLVAVLAVACGGNKPAGNGSNTATDGAKCGGGEAAADAFALYKKKGRKWVLKSTTKMEGMDPMVSYMEYEIVDVTDKSAKQKMTVLDKEKKPMAGGAPTETEIKFETPKVEAPKCGAKAPEMKKEKIKVEAGEFECYFTEVSGTKSWSSVEYPGLAVKSEGANNTMELISFDK